MIGFTAFESVFDNKTHRRYMLNTWNDFVAALEAMSKREGYKPKKGDFKKGSPLITPAMFKKDSTRANDNVIGWKGWAALDIDEYEGTFEQVLNNFKDYRYVCYSTASSTKEHPKFRMVLDLNCDVHADKIKHLWYAMNKEFNEFGDPQTKDLSRMYYVPAVYPNAYNFFYTNEGRQLNVGELMRKHDFIQPTATFLSKLPPEMQEAILAHRKSELNNTSVTWTSYHDCPFVNKKLVNDYRAIANVDGTGRYVKMYSILVNIASNATKAKYPITAKQMAELCRQLDNETSQIYKNRNLELEAGRALEFILGNSL